MLYVADGSEKKKKFMYCLIPTDMLLYLTAVIIIIINMCMCCSDI